MAKWWNNVKTVGFSRGKRFLGSFDMAEAKRADSILNSQIKRGEKPNYPHRYLSVCGCGASGCIIASGYFK